MTSFDVDAEKDIIEIRHLKAKGYSDNQILSEYVKQGGSRATYYRRRQQMREQMMEAIKEQDNPQMMEDILLCRVRLEDCIRRIEEQLDVERVKGEELTVSEIDKLVARKEEIALNIARLQYDTAGVLTRVDANGEQSKVDNRRTDTEEEPAGDTATNKEAE